MAAPPVIIGTRSIKLVGVAVGVLKFSYFGKGSGTFTVTFPVFGNSLPVNFWGKFFGKGVPLFGAKAPTISTAAQQFFNVTKILQGACSRLAAGALLWQGFVLQYRVMLFAAELFIIRGQKGAQPLALWVFKNLGGSAAFGNNAVIHKNNLVGDLARKGHFVRYNNHGHVAVG